MYTYLDCELCGLDRLCISKINPFHLDYHIYGLGNAHIFHYEVNVHCLCSGFSSFFFNSFFFLFFFFWLCFSRHVKSSISKSGIKLSPAVEVQRLYHWNTEEVLFVFDTNNLCSVLFLWLTWLGSFLFYWSF